MTAPLDPQRTALLVMDYQYGIGSRLDDPGPLLDRAEELVARGIDTLVLVVSDACADTVSDVHELARLVPVRRCTSPGRARRRRPAPWWAGPGRRPRRLRSRRPGG